MPWPGHSIVVDDASTFKLVAATWLFFLVAGTVLLLLGTFALPLVIGVFQDEPPGVTTEIFFRKQCDNGVCASGGSMPDHGYWAASLMIFWVGIALLVFAMGLIIFALCSSAIHIDLGKTVISVAHTFLLVAWLLLVIGLGDLSDECAANQIHCGLKCNDGIGNEFAPFYLCEPWVGGTGMWALFSGTAILFFSSFLAFSLKLKKVPDVQVTHTAIQPSTTRRYVQGGPGGAGSAAAVSPVQSFMMADATPYAVTARNVVYQRAANNRQMTA
jgi:hypothetical protein